MLPTMTNHPSIILPLTPIVVGLLGGCILSNDEYLRAQLAPLAEKTLACPRTEISTYQCLDEKCHIARATGCGRTATYAVASGEWRPFGLPTQSTQRPEFAPAGGQASRQGEAAAPIEALTAQQEEAITRFTVEDLPADVQDTEVHVTEVAPGGALLFRVAGKSEAIDGKVWFFCTSTLELGPNVRVAWSTFTTYVNVDDRPNQGGGAYALRTSGIANAQWQTGHGVVSTGYVAAGSDGATFKKRGSDFVLVDGDARMLPATRKRLGGTVELAGGDLLLKVSKNGETPQSQVPQARRPLAAAEPSTISEIQQFLRGVDGGWIVTENPGDRGKLFVHRSKSGNTLVDLIYLVKVEKDGTWTVYIPTRAAAGSGFGRRVGTVAAPRSVSIGLCGCR